MKMKKLCALIMALAMALSLAVPAFADDNSETGDTQNVTVSSTNSAGAIQITVPNSSAIILNPYQMKVTLAANATIGTDAVTSYHQIISAPVKCTNKSTFGLNVEAKLTGTLPEATPANKAAFVSEIPADTETANKVFLYGEFGVSTDETEPTWATAFSATNKSQYLVTGSATPEAKVVATLPAASASTPNYLWYTFNGVAAKNPTSAWAANDKVDVAIALTLKPTVNTVYNVNLTNTVSKTAAGTSTVSYDVAPEGETITVTCTPDAVLDGTPTVTVKQGSTAITVEGDASPFTFTMPAGDVTVTVKWA